MVSSVGGASHALLAAQVQRYRDQATPVAPPVLEVDKQAVSKAQVAVNRSDVLYL